MTQNCVDPKTGLTQHQALELLIQGVKVGQTKGSYNLDEAALLSRAVKTFLKQPQNNDTSTEQNNDTSTEQNNDTSTEQNNDTSTEQNNDTSTEQNNDTSTEQNNDTSTEQKLAKISLDNLEVVSDLT